MRLIDADKLERDLESLKQDYEDEGCDSKRIDGIDDCIEEIRYTEPIDAVPVIHAHWIEFRANNGNAHYKCSHCGKEVSYSYAKKRWKYCIECGAKMDEGKLDDDE